MNTDQQDSKEFNTYASQDYEKLLKDPLKNAFGSELDFFLEVKIKVLERILKQNVSEASMLDLGCGNGKFTSLSSKLFKTSLGTDISIEMLKGKNHSKICVSAGEALPFISESFDCITAVCIFHHIMPADRPAVMNEIYRLLKPGGQFFMFEHNPYNPLTRWIVKRSPVDQNAVLVWPSEVGSLFAPFKNIDISYFLFYPEKLFPILGWTEKLLQWLPLGGQYVAIGQKA